MASPRTARERAVAGIMSALIMSFGLLFIYWNIRGSFPGWVAPTLKEADAYNVNMGIGSFFIALGGWGVLWTLQELGQQTAPQK